MIKTKNGYVTSLEAAKILGFSQDHIRRMILQDKIKAVKLGHCWIIQLSDLKDIKRKRFPKLEDNTTHGSD